MSLDVYLAYLLAVTLVVVIPGPSVTLIIANSLRHGTRAGLLSVAGTQIGIAVLIALVGLGLASLATTMSWWFDWLRLAGAAYLVFLGWKMLRAPAPEERRAGAVAAPRPSHGFLLQGLLVALSNPKTLFFFGAFLPQFVNPHGDTTQQIAILGATALGVAAVSDSAYALLAGRAGTLVSRRRAASASSAAAPGWPSRAVASSCARPSAEAPPRPTSPPPACGTASSSPRPAGHRRPPHGRRSAHPAPS
jgi:homoserine/homoserine lactone efflux protein